MSDPIITHDQLNVHTPEPAGRYTMTEEQTLLARALVYPDTLPADVLALPAGHFSSERNAELWRHLASRAINGHGADPTAVAEHFRHIPGMVEYIQKLVPRGIGDYPHNPHSLAKVISEGHRSRVTESAITAAYQQLKAGNVVAAQDIMAGLDTTDGQTDNGATLTEAWSKAKAEAEDDDLAYRVPSPWKRVNELLNGGFKPRETYFFGGPPGVGKTATAQQICDHAGRNDYRVAFFSLEMDCVDLARRMMSTAGGVDMAETQRQQLDMTKDSHERVDEALESIGDRIVIWDDPEVTISDIRERARIAVLRRGCRLIVIDYAQLIEADDPRLDERQAIEKVIKGLRLMARELRVPVVALAQPNRNAAMQDRKLTMTDFLGSGAFERYGAAAILLNPEFEEHPETGEKVRTEIAEFTLDKNRYGQRGSVRMVADLARQRFVEL